MLTMDLTVVDNSIYGIVLEHLSYLQQSSPLSTLDKFSSHAVLNPFYNDINHDAVTTSTHSKRTIELLKNRPIMFMILLLYGTIQIVLMFNIDIIQYYIYCQYWRMHIISELTEALDPC